MILLALANLPTPPWPDAPSPQELPELVRRAAEGDVRAFERLVVQYQGKVRSFARSFAPDHDEAADLAQEALVKVYRSIGSFRFESSFTTWLFRIVKNTFLDAVKSRAAKERSLQEPLDGEGERLAEAALAEERLLREEDRAAVWRAIARVPESYRAVLVLFDVEGLAYDEIAQVLGMPVGTVKSRLNRGREALRQALFRARRDP